MDSSERTRVVQGAWCFIHGNTPCSHTLVYDVVVSKSCFISRYTWVVAGYNENEK
jgi:hypothetical protein